MKYKCVYPNCDYETNERSLIHFHHVVPRELKRKLNRRLTLPFCPIHHNLIFHPDSQSGQHSEIREGSLVIEQVAPTNTGKAIIYRDMAGNEITVNVDVRKVTAGTISVLRWDIVNGLTEEELIESDPKIESVVDRRGYCTDGHSIYFTDGFRHVAADLLSGIISTYIAKMEGEYEKALAKAKADRDELDKI